MPSLILALLIGLIFVFGVSAETVEINRDPEKIKFVTSDINNFWLAYDLAQKESDNEKKIAIFQTQYFAK
jgi:hypothetical protein